MEEAVLCRASQTRSVLRFIFRDITPFLTELFAPPAPFTTLNKFLLHLNIDRSINPYYFPFLKGGTRVRGGGMAQW